MHEWKWIFHSWSEAAALLRAERWTSLAHPYTQNPIGHIIHISIWQYGMVRKWRVSFFNYTSVRHQINEVFLCSLVCPRKHCAPFIMPHRFGWHANADECRPRTIQCTARTQFFSDALSIVSGGGVEGGSVHSCVSNTRYTDQDINFKNLLCVGHINCIVSFNIKTNIAFGWPALGHSQ